MSTHHLTAIFQMNPSLIEVTIDASAAKRHLEHLSDCPSCAVELQKHQEHASALVSVMSAARDVKPDDMDPLDEAIEAAELEVKVFVDSIVRRFGKDIPPSFTAPLSSDELARWGPSDGAVTDFRVSLAVSEILLTLASLLSERPGEVAALRAGALTFSVSGRSIPEEYFARRISDNAGVTHEDGLSMWRRVLDIAERGKVGLPGFRLDHGRIEADADPPAHSSASSRSPNSRGKGRVPSVPPKQIDSPQTPTG